MLVTFLFFYFKTILVMINYIYKYIKGVIKLPKGTGKLIAQNKKARHEYYIEDTYEAGLVLQGTEIKSIRLGKVSINDAYAHIEHNQAYIYNMHITQYEFGTKSNHEPTRTRKLLLNKKEITRLYGLQQQQ